MAADAAGSSVVDYLVRLFCRSKAVGLTGLVNSSLISKREWSATSFLVCIRLIENTQISALSPLP